VNNSVYSIFFPGVLDGICKLKLFYGKSQLFFVTTMVNKAPYQFKTQSHPLLRMAF
jgi:hypothetical protein